ncbi:MAG: aminomethyl-transferring glycine dehydrogenase subunit GcvPA [Planctomycetales bacterium]|nr:aminomethyl-transferring glycine dehydrogenase subunit GcvPA [Planctomycetales bacterium]
MPFVFNTPEDQAEMLKSIGVDSIEALFECIPEPLRLQRTLSLPPAMSELELAGHMQQLARRNTAPSEAICFLGGGSYDHFIPAVVDVVASRSEFYTSYTPYQPEVSQGNLQATFEYQSLVCELTGMDVSNASLYDGGSATVEAAIMAINATKRRKIIVSATVHPEYRQVLRTYFERIDVELVTAPAANGVTDLQQLAGMLDDETAGVVMQHPNFFGCLEPLQDAADLAHESGAMMIACFDPISLGLLARPGDLGADIVVAEGQSLGSPMQYGGPYLGIIACRAKLIRRMPGRIVGQTVDRRGRKCYVLTLQPREQHISRERATSNICTNQGLFALRAAVYLSCLGPQGLRETAELCLHKARYAAEQLAQLERFEMPFAAPTFKEFVLRDRHGRVEDLLASARRQGILAGVPLGTWYDDLQDCLLISVTEKRTKAEIDALVRALATADSDDVLEASRPCEVES